MLDTGAATTGLNYDMFTASFNSTNKNESSGAIAKKTDDLIVVSKIELGSLSQNDVTVARASKDSKGRRNVLGMNFLKHYLLHFIFSQKKVVTVDNISKVLENSKTFDLILGERSHPYVDLIWQGGVKAQGVWDTGAGMTCFDSGFVKKHPALFSKIGSSIGTDSSGSQAETPVYMMKSFSLGGHQFPEAKVVVIDLSVPNSTIKIPMDFILGYSVLKEANWVFDFPNKKWGISKMLGGGASG